MASRRSITDNLHFGGLSHGPGGNGSIKPDVLAPSGELALSPAYMGPDPNNGNFKAGLYEMPSGYSIGGGTSQATPTMAAAIAVLLSAAKQAGLPHDVGRINFALRNSGRLLANYEPFEQGNGIVQLARAFEILKALRNMAPIVITAIAPVRTAVSSFLAVPNTGVGLFEREGWTAGMSGTRVVTLTRRNGVAGPMRFAITWAGNDGTFTAPSSVVLPLGTPQGLRIGISPRTNGPHSALLTLDNPAVPGHAYRMEATIVAAERFTAANHFSVKRTILVQRPGDRSIFVDVPAGVAALHVTSTSKQDVRLIVRAPDSSDEGAVTPKSGVPGTITIDHPVPGVWEINSEATNDAFEYNALNPAPLPAASAEIEAEIYGATVAQSDSTADRFAIQNRFAPLAIGAVTSALGSGISQTAMISDGEQQVYPIQVLPGSQRLIAQTMSLDPKARIDLYLFDCTHPACAPEDKDTGWASSKRVTIANPKAGKWIVVVDALSIPSGRAQYEYTDLFTNPRFGTLAIADALQSRASGARWNVEASSWVADGAGASLTQGRSLFGLFGLNGEALGELSGYAMFGRTSSPDATWPPVLISPLIFKVPVP